MIDDTVAYIRETCANALNGKVWNKGVLEEIGTRGGNVVDVWEDEGDGGFVFITDDDVRVACTFGVQNVGPADVADYLSSLPIGNEPAGTEPA